MSDEKRRQVSPQVINVRADIAPHLHIDSTTGGYKEITEIYVNNTTGTIIYQTDTYKSDHTPDHRWYTVGHTSGWTTTRAASAGDPADELGYFDFYQAIETRDSILIAVRKKEGGEHDKNMVIVDFKALLPYRKV
jgi:hypothetical protein